MAWCQTWALRVPAVAPLGTGERMERRSTACYCQKASTCVSRDSEQPFCSRNFVEVSLFPFILRQQCHTDSTESKNQGSAWMNSWGKVTQQMCVQMAQHMVHFCSFQRMTHSSSCFPGLPAEGLSQLERSRHPDHAGPAGPHSWGPQISMVTHEGLSQSLQ